MKDVNDFLLTEKVSVRKLKEWLADKETYKNEITELIFHRFNNRYIKHVEKVDSGFLIMAVSCLMIEALESFKQGMKDTSGRGVGKQIFIDFFRTEQKYFPGFSNRIAREFYKHIRCGILHQAETTNAWRIIRKEELINIKDRSINATAFVMALKKSLDGYISNLKSKDFSELMWANAETKLLDICENCKVKI